MLGASESPLHDAYDLAMLDLDGVVYIDGEAVPGAPDHLASAAKSGMRLAYITNNASRPAAVVAAHLGELGVPAREEDVVTSSQAAARVLRDRFGAGARVALLGAAGLETALRERGPRAGAGRRRGRRARHRLRPRRRRGGTSCGPRCASATGCRGSPATPT